MRQSAMLLVRAFVRRHALALATTARYAGLDPGDVACDIYAGVQPAIAAQAGIIRLRRISDDGPAA